MVSPSSSSSGGSFGSSGPDYKSQVLAATDIVQLIGQTVGLKRRGKDFLGLCPFHQEKTPSFHVSPTKQFYHCFGCKESGNAIDFVMKRDRVEFREALRQLADAAGIELKYSAANREKQNERQALLDAHVAAVSFYESKLNDPAIGAAAREYLTGRGFTDETLKKWRVGVAPDGWDHLLRAPVMRKYPPQILAAAGLVKARDNGSGFYDTFRNRILFPIRDDVGRTIAFGGRVMPGAQDAAKYLNSPETPLFNKSRSVFGLDFAKQRMTETRVAAVVEGYTDVMMAHQFGVSNVVAVLGTGMTEHHVTLLRRFADKIVLLFDADAAGDKAADRVVQLFLTQPVEIGVASMPEGLDPDEFLLNHGAEAFEKVLADAIDVLTFKWKLLAKQFMAHKNDLTGQQQAVEQYLELLADARGSGPVDSLRWGSALARVSRLTEIPIDELNRRFRAPRVKPAPLRPQPNFAPPAQGNGVSEPTNRNPAEIPNAAQTPVPVSPPSSAGPPVPSARRVAERWILGILLTEPERWHDVQVHVHVEDFLDPRHRRIAEVYWTYQRDEGELVFSTFLGLVDDPSLKELSIALVDEIEGFKERSANSRVGGVAAAGTSDGDAADAVLDQTLAEAVGYLTEAKRNQEQRKLLAALRRTSEENDDDNPGQDERALLEALLKNNPSTNLRRIGPVKRAR